MIRSGITLTDDSPKFTRNQQAGQQSPERSDLSVNDPESILRLLEARLKLSSGGATREGGVSEKETIPACATRPVSQRDAVEYTPTPMVIEGAVESTRHWDDGGYGFERKTKASPASVVTRPMPVVQRRSGNDDSASQLLPDERNPESSISYHAPRRPPESIDPPTPLVSFSVAPEYDPRAPTKPRVRRVSTRPPVPLFSGRDRMLVWGMVLGGGFVAAIVVLVHRLAPSRQVGAEPFDGLRNSAALFSAKSSPAIAAPIELTLPTGTPVPSTKQPVVDAGIAVKREVSAASSASVRVRKAASQQVNQSATDKSSTLWIE